MNTFFSLVQKTLLTTVIICFAVVTLYTPQTNLVKTDRAEASARASEATQLLNMGLLGASKLIQTAANSFLNSLQMKEYVLDPIAWVAAKTLIASATNSIVSWVNSGFDGAPMFVQNLKNYMQTIDIDITAEFIDELGVAEFVTGPFRADIQAAFARGFVHQVQSSAPAGVSIYDTSFDQKLVSLTERGEFGADSWDDWFRIVNDPMTYTPYGNLLAVQREGDRRSQEAQQNETNLLSFGDGFISNKVCNDVPSTLGHTINVCEVATPGQTISESLNLHLGSGINSLIAADEISEILADLVVNLGMSAIGGAAGLLGLSPNTGYTDTSQGGIALIDAMTQQQQSNADNTAGDINNLINNDLNIVNNYLAVAGNAQSAYQKLGQSDSDIAGTIINLQANKSSLETLQTSLNDGTYTPTEAMGKYTTITPKYQSEDISNSSERWAYDVRAGIMNTYDRLYSYNTQMNSLRNQLTNTFPQTDAIHQAIADIVTEIQRIAPALADLHYDLSNPTSGGGLAARYLNRSISSEQVFASISALDIPNNTEINGNLNHWRSLVR